MKGNSKLPPLGPRVTRTPQSKAPVNTPPTPPQKTSPQPKSPKKQLDPIEESELLQRQIAEEFGITCSDSDIDDESAKLMTNLWEDIELNQTVLSPIDPSSALVASSDFEPTGDLLADAQRMIDESFDSIDRQMSDRSKLIEEQIRLHKEIQEILEKELTSESKVDLELDQFPSFVKKPKRRGEGKRI